MNGLHSKGWIRFVAGPGIDVQPDGNDIRISQGESKTDREIFIHAGVLPLNFIGGLGIAVCTRSDSVEIINIDKLK